MAVRPSIGLTLATAHMKQSSVSSLIRQADLAMYAAKRDGGACLGSFVPDLSNPYELPGDSRSASRRRRPTLMGRRLAVPRVWHRSVRQLLDLGLVATIARLLRTHDLPPESLILEITESTLTTDSQRARNTVAALRRLGTRLSLDDYGTGWSSLARLQDLSVDELKLDQVFVARLALDPRSIAIVRSTVALAHSLGADLVAEGVEDDATLRALRQYGCNITQGNVHSPPLPARGDSEVAHGALPHAEIGAMRGR